MSRIGLGDDHQAGGVLVEAVDDAWSFDAADAGQAGAAMRDQRIDQSAGGMTRGRMNDKPLRLVDHDDRVVLVDDVERDRLALRGGGSGGGSVTVTTSPDLTAAAGSRIVRPAIFTWPARIKAFRCERESVAICAASTRSSRAPASSSAIVTVSVTLSVMVQDMSDDDEKPLDPEAARIVARVRRLMMIASMTTFVAVAVVLGVIGYRVFTDEGRVQPAPRMRAHPGRMARASFRAP